MISARIRSFFGPYPVRMRENTDEKDSEYGRFSRSVMHLVRISRQKVLLKKTVTRYWSSISLIIISKLISKLYLLNEA